jgi:hypothetical protein
MPARARIGAEAYSGGAKQGLFTLRGGETSRGQPWRDVTIMVQGNRLHHDIEVAERATVTLLMGLLLAAFVVLAAGATVYDIGKWLAVW